MKRRPGIHVGRIRVRVAFAASATGTRRPVIKRNGARFAGRVESTAEPGGGGDRTLHGWTPALPVSPGDALTVEVDQDSGAALDLLAGDPTWLAIEQVG